jgi:hypothetical protein
MKTWTDYPITELGDEPGKIAPIRECTVLNYDGNKYCDVRVDGVLKQIKRAYIYIEEGRVGEVMKWQPEHTSF